MDSEKRFRVFVDVHRNRRVDVVIDPDRLETSPL
jgi:hypothetical protein